MMSTGAPAMPKELIGMEYWTSLFVQVWISLDAQYFLALVFVFLQFLVLMFSCPLTCPLCMRSTPRWLLRLATVLEMKTVLGLSGLHF